MKIFFLLLLLALPTISTATSTIDCHCFQDRSFDQHKSTDADPYFLATTQNSFLSLVYGINKRNIVKAKMSGENGAQLWILYDLAQRSNKSTKQLKKIYAKNNSWVKTFKKLKFPQQPLNDNYQQLGDKPEQLADYIVDLHLTTFFDVTMTELKNWRAQGMNRKELILAILLNGKPEAIYNQVTSGTKSWGELLFEQGLLDGDAINKKLKEQMSPSS